MQGRYTDVLGNLRDHCARDGNFTGAVIIGSQVQPLGADRWSDLDLMLVAQDRDALSREGAWFEHLGAVLAVCDDVSPLPWLDWNWRVRRVLFADGRDVDFSLIPDDRLDQAVDANSAILDRGYEILYDAFPGRLEQAISNRNLQEWPPPRTTTPDRLRIRLDDLLYHLVWAAKKRARGEVWQAARVLNQHNAPILLEFAESCGDLESGTSDLLAYEGRYLEWRLSPDILAALDGCLARYNGQDVDRAIRRQHDAAALFAALIASELGIGLGDQLDRVAALLTELADNR